VEPNASKDRELEALVIKRFFQKDKVIRFIGFIQKESLRRKFIATLAHSKDLDFSKFRKVDRNEEAIILEAAAKLKVDTCYVISENSSIDGRTKAIKEALQKTIGYGMGTLLVFGSAEMIYYEGEEINDRWFSTV